MGDVQTNSDSQPTIIPELQNRSVISVILGDYHYGALTSDGQLLTWGQYSSGALGLGLPTKLPVGSPGVYSTEEQRDLSDWHRPEPPDVPSPSPVHFNHGPNPGGRRFCFAATAAGWHTGALVICLDVRFPLMKFALVIKMSLR
jgi:SCF-associated factor 1